MSDDQPTVDAYNGETGDHVVRGRVTELDHSIWQQFKRIFGPVLEGAGVAIGATVSADTLATHVSGGAVSYTLTALAMMALYFWYRL